MLHNPARNFCGFRYDNFGSNPSATPGTSVTPGASNAEGSWTQIASGANIAQDIVAFMLWVSNGATATAAKPHLLDVGVDESGGTSYTAVISNIVCGASGTGIAIPGHRFLFPLRIKAGSTVAVRIQGANATAGTVRVSASFYGQCANMLLLPVGTFSETLGTITNSNGPTITPGNAADGSWVDMGATTKPLWWWQLGYQIDNATITAEYTYIELAWGNATNKHRIMRLMHGGDTSERVGDFLGQNMNVFECLCPVPAGVNVYIRARCNNAPDTGYNAVAVGIG